MTVPTLSPLQQQAVATYFGGDATLFCDYRGACLLQFPHDIVTADAAASKGDLTALRLLVHSLKSVLLTLGYPEMQQMALHTEHRCKAGELEPARDGWSQLRQQLQQLVDSA